jgi:hypothetical protein
VAFHFLQDFVRAALVLVLEVENGIDEVLALQGANAILPAEAGEESAVVKGGLGVEINLGCPPGRGAIFEFGPEGVEVVAGALRAEGGEILDLEITGLFEVMIVGDDLGALLSLGSQRTASSERQEQEKKAEAKAKDGQAGVPLQVICNKNIRQIWSDMKCKNFATRSAPTSGLFYPLSFGGYS